jgi:hypothetical protein
MRVADGTEDRDDQVRQELAARGGQTASGGKTVPAEPAAGVKE